MSLITTILSGLGSAYTTSTTCLDPEGNIIPKRRNTAIATSITTTACGTLQSIDEFRVINKAQAYLDSLSTEELAELDEKLSAKELEFTTQKSIALESETMKVKEKHI